MTRVMKRWPRERSSLRKAVFFHIGAPKSGTTFLQDMLLDAREDLAEVGVLNPVERFEEHLAATMDLCERSFGGRRPASWDGAWERITGRIRASSAKRAIFSAELMSLATREQAARAIASVQPADVHVIFTARDLARQIPSEWQEQIKHRHTVPFNRFVDDLVERGLDAPAPFGELFWGTHDPIYVLSKWDGLVPPERIHLVTVAPSGAPPDALWRRFASVVGIEPSVGTPVSSRTNSGMGLAQAEFMRRFNLATQGRLTSAHGPTLNRVLGQEILASSDGEQIRLPARHHDWVQHRSASMIANLSDRGYHIVGDLDDLLPRLNREPQADPDGFPPAKMNRVAYDAVAGLVEVIASLRVRNRRLTELLDQLDPTWATAFEQMANSELDVMADADNDEVGRQ